MALSQNGWQTQPTTTHLWNLPDVTGKVLAGPVWVVLHWLAVMFVERVEKITRGHSWGWSYRRIAGSSKWSNHASGTAVDFNAVAHPRGKSGTFTKAQVAAIKAIISMAGGVLRWGGTYPGRQVDEMHFEIAPDVRPATVEKLATRILQQALVDLGYNLGTYGPAHNGVDGERGTKTLAALKAFQQANDLTPDMVDGPLTWASLDHDLKEKKAA